MTVGAGYHCAAEGYEYHTYDADWAYYRTLRIRDEFFRYVRLFRDVGWAGRLVLLVAFPVALMLWVVFDQLVTVHEQQLRRSA